jgi:type VI secretion system secreted protein VgrG
MESMSRSSLQIALGGLVVCAIGGFWLGLQGALPHDGGTRGAEVSSSEDTPGPTASLTAVEAAPFTEAAPPSEEPAAEESDAAPVQTAALAPVKKPAAETPKPAPAASATPASATPPAPPPAQPAPSATPAPTEDLPPY